MSHHEENHNTGPKPVAFTAPMILGAVTIFIILLFVSLGNPSHCECNEGCSKECMEACEKGDHSKHPSGEAKAGETSNEAKPAEESAHH